MSVDERKLMVEGFFGTIKGGKGYKKRVKGAKWFGQ